MDPAPNANPHAELVTEGFGGCPGFDSPARNWSPTTPPDKRSWWGVVIEPAVSKEEDQFRDEKVVDVGCEEDDMPRSYWGWLPGFDSHAGEHIRQGQHTWCGVEDMSKLEVHGSCNLPSLKDLGLDLYIRKRN